MVKLKEETIRGSRYLIGSNVKLDIDNVEQVKIGLYNIYGYLWGCVVYG